MPLYENGFVAVDCLFDWEHKKSQAMLSDPARNIDELRVEYEAAIFQVSHWLELDEYLQMSVWPKGFQEALSSTISTRVFNELVMAEHNNGCLSASDVIVGVFFFSNTSLMLRESISFQSVLYKARSKH